KFDLTFAITERDETLTGALEYSSELFDRTTASRMAMHLQAVLASIVSSPGVRVLDISLLSAAGAPTMLFEHNDSSSEYPSDESINSLFRRQCEAVPHSIALVSGDQHITYGMLDDRATILAARLSLSGAKSDAPVGLPLARSAQTVVNMLGIL